MFAFLRKANIPLLCFFNYEKLLCVNRFKFAEKAFEDVTSSPNTGTAVVRNFLALREGFLSFFLANSTEVRWPRET
jgi:hypothetical protein